jgi:hypothetical protein
MPEKKTPEFLYEGSDYLFSLNKLLGKKVTDVVGYPTAPFGGTPLFRISQIIFEDGTSMFVEGEHDVAYLPADDEVTNMDEETLQKFIDEKTDESDTLSP